MRAVKLQHFAWVLEDFQNIYVKSRVVAREQFHATYSLEEAAAKKIFHLPYHVHALLCSRSLPI